jgi:type 1 glutamine amidotransferase
VLRNITRRRPDNPIPSGDFAEYVGTITAPNHEVVKGVESFRQFSEQYFRLVDPSNEMLASATFSGVHLGG